MKEKAKLNYRFHDPNPPGVMTDYLVNLFVEVNMPKAEAAIQSAIKELPDKVNVLNRLSKASDRCNAKAPRKSSAPNAHIKLR